MKEGRKRRSPEKEQGNLLFGEKAHPRPRFRKNNMFIRPKKNPPSKQGLGKNGELGMKGEI